MNRKLVVAAVLAAAVPLAALAEERATPREAEALVHKAVTFLKQQGREKAFAAFNDPQGAFAFRDLYVMVYDLEGNCLAHGAKKDRVGKNFLNDKDADGRPFVKERMELARKSPRGWQEYKFMNPATKKIEPKVAYFEVVDGMVVMSGAYRP